MQVCIIRVLFNLCHLNLALNILPLDISIATNIYILYIHLHVPFFYKNYLKYQNNPTNCCTLIHSDTFHNNLLLLLLLLFYC